MSESYTCGCGVDDPRFKTYFIEIITGPFGKTQTNKRFNSSGEQVCPEHGLPLHGSAGGNQYERRYGRVNGSMPGSLTVDLRDNRDPTQVGLEVLASSNGHH